MMRNKLLLCGRNGVSHTLRQKEPDKYSIECDYIRVIFDNNEILAIDPPSGPYMTVGFKFRYRHQNYRIVGFSRFDEPLLIEIEEVI